MGNQFENKTKKHTHIKTFSDTVIQLWDTKISNSYLTLVHLWGHFWLFNFEFLDNFGCVNAYGMKFGKDVRFLSKLGNSTSASIKSL